MDCLRVEKGNIKGSYKLIMKFEQVDSSKAWAVYFKTKLEAGEKKRIREGDRTLKQQSCYYT